MEIKDLNVVFISLVDSPANRKSIILKAKERNHRMKVFKLAKVNAKKQLVYGIVYSPNETDAHGDYATAETIERAAHNFMKEAYTQNVDVQHDENVYDQFVAESWVTRQNDAVFPDEPIGSWAVAIKVLSDDVWQKVESGEIQGLSLAGFGKREDFTDGTVTTAKSNESSSPEEISESDEEIAETAEDIETESAPAGLRGALRKIVDSVREFVADNPDSEQSAEEVADETESEVVKQLDELVSFVKTEHSKLLANLEKVNNRLSVIEEIPLSRMSLDSTDKKKSIWV